MPTAEAKETRAETTEPQERDEDRELHPELLAEMRI